MLNVTEPPRQIQVSRFGVVAEAGHNRRDAEENGHISECALLADQIRSAGQVLIELLEDMTDVR